MNLLNVNLQDSINLGKFKKFVFIKCFYFFRLKKFKKKVSMFTLVTI